MRAANRFRSPVGRAASVRHLSRPYPADPMISGVASRQHGLGAGKSNMSRRIFYDGLNLSLEHGTGIATYTRMLARIARDLGYEVGVVYSSPQRPSKNPLLREIGFFDSREAAPVSLSEEEIWNALSDQSLLPLGVEPSAVNLTGHGDHRSFPEAGCRRMTICSSHAICLPMRGGIFRGAAALSIWRSTARRTSCTAPTNCRCAPSGPCNIYTIHDLVPLRLPFTTLDNKRQTYRLLRKIAAEADHIVTVSENSKRDIVELLGVPEERVDETYEAVEFPPRTDRAFRRPHRGAAAQLVSAGVAGLSAVLWRPRAEKERRPADRRLHAVGRSISRW